MPLYATQDKNAYVQKVLEIFATRNAASRPLMQAVGNIQSIAREMGGDIASRQYTVRRRVLTGSRGGQVNIGSTVKPAMSYAYKNDVFSVKYGELFVEEDYRQIKDGVLTEEQVLTDLINSLVDAHDAAYIGDPSLFADGTLSINQPLTVNSSLLSLSSVVGANSVSAVDWSDTGVGISDIYNELNLAKNTLENIDKAKRNIDTLYISKQAWDYAIQKPYASDNQEVWSRVEDKMGLNVVVDPFLNGLSYDGTDLASCFFMFDSRDISWYTDLMPEILDGDPRIARNTFTLGAEVRLGGIHNVSPYDIPLYRVSKLLG